MRLIAMAALALACSASAAQAQRTHVLVVSGLAGEPRFAASFAEWTKQLTDAARTRLGASAADVTVLSEKGDAAAKATRDNVVAAIGRITARATSQDDVLLVLFGHGSESGGEAKLNLPGPDLTAPELAAALAGVKARRVVVVNTASASGGFVGALQGANRVVITATKSGAEQNETMFPRFFVAALAGEAADTDKDGRTSMLEAFEYARREVERAYASTQRLQTEHPVIDADGDGQGTAKPVAASGDGAAAALAFIGSGRPAASAAAAPPSSASPQLRALYDEKSRIEGALDALRRRKDQLPAAEYERELERLLLELSRNGQAIRRLEGGAQ